METQKLICNLITKLIRKWIILLQGHRKTNMRASAKTRQELHGKYSDAFSGIGCFKGTFSLQVKEGVTSYQALPMHMTYTFQKPLERL